MNSIFALLLGYLLGSIPFGLILTNLLGDGNLRQTGSGNIGATNVLRTGRKGLALATLLLDAAKGAAAVLLIPRIFELDLLLIALAALGVILGHCFPIWLRFKGGKGVATMLGVSFGIDWRIGLACALAWLAAALVTRISSVGGIVSAVAAPAVALALFATDRHGTWETFGLLVFHAPTLAIMALVVIFQHRANIARLRAGTEPKIGQKG